MRNCVPNLAEHVRYSRATGGRRPQPRLIPLLGVNYSTVAGFTPTRRRTQRLLREGSRQRSGPRHVNNNTNKLTSHTQALVFSSERMRKKKKTLPDFPTSLPHISRKKLNFFISSRRSPFHHRAPPAFDIARFRTIFCGLIKQVEA